VGIIKGDCIMFWKKVNTTDEIDIFQDYMDEGLVPYPDVLNKEQDETVNEMLEQVLNRLHIIEKKIDSLLESS